jgi:hypothetical protein
MSISGRRLAALQVVNQSDETKPKKLHHEPGGVNPPEDVQLVAAAAEQHFLV